MKPTRPLTLAVLLLAVVPVLGQQKKEEAPPTADVVRDADAARKRGDVTRAASLFASAQRAKDFANARPPVDLILTVGDYHFARASLESQEQALATYDLAFSVYGPSLSPFDTAQVRARRAEVLSWQGKMDLAQDEINTVRTQYKDDRRVNLLADLASANLLLLSNQAQAARDALGPLVEINDPVITPAAMFAMGRAYVQLKQSDDAVNTFRKLWNRYGESDFVKRAVYLIGQVYFDRGDFLEARKLYEACGVVGAAMQTSVRVGDELVVKVADPDYYARTRSTILPVTITTPSGDRESLRLEKNQVSDQLYIGRIQTALLLPNPDDDQLQVGGGDLISIAYAGQTGKPYEVRVVDDGSVQIDSVEMPLPKPRHERSLPTQAPRVRRDPNAEPIIIPTGKLASGAVSPGSPIYVQLVDADFDTTDKPDTAEAEVLATDKGKTTDSVKITLTETGPRTGVFRATASTEPLVAGAVVSSEQSGHAAYHSIDGNDDTFWKPDPKALKDGQKHFIEINLRQPTNLASLTWGAGPKQAGNAPKSMRVILRGDDTDVTIPVAGKSDPLNNRVDLKNTFARIVRIEFDEFAGDAPALAQVVVLDQSGRELIPTGVDPNAPQRQANLAFDVGYQVFARFVDEENENPARKTTRESSKLGVRYQDATLSLAAASGEGDMVQMSPAWRIEREGRQWVVISDSDLDTTPQKDLVTLKVFSEIGDEQEISAEETGPATGSFAAPLPIATGQAAMENPRLLRVGVGDLVWFTYDDARNMSPGYRTFRHAWVLENQPKVGDFADQPLVTTAWPFEVRPTADGQMQAIPREMGKGRIAIEYADPDAFSDGTKSITTRLNALVGETTAELALLPRTAGRANRTIDLVLGDKETAAQMQAGAEGPLGEMSVAGDDILRIATTDEQVSTYDVVLRAVADEQSLEAPVDEATKDVLPVVRLADPIREMQKRQESRLSALRTQMGERLLAYRLATEDFAAYQSALAKRIKSANEDTELLEALKRQSAIVETQRSVFAARIERLKALGATEAPALPETLPASPEPQPADPVKAVVDGPIIPGRAFEILIDDPDLKKDEVEVRVRSIDGRMVDTVTTNATRTPNGTFAARIETDRSSDRSDPARLSLLPGGQVMVDYVDTTEITGPLGERVQYVALASDATVRSLNSNYVDDVSQIRLGQDVYLEVVDYDADRTGALDSLVAKARSKRGDALPVLLTETEPHSGVFRGTFKTDFAPPIVDDDVLQGAYGGAIEIVYSDYMRMSPGSPVRKNLTLNITGGADGTIETFSRQFRDSREEMELWFRTGQAAYEVGRRMYLSGNLSRAEEYLTEATDHFAALVTRFPDDPLAANGSYYLGNIAALRERHRRALDYFEAVVNKWPKSDFVAQARFKIGQAYEGLGQFEQASDAYVLLTYHHPDDSHVPLAMIRMMNHYARGESWDDAVAIAQRFVEKFKAHDQAGAVALKAGQWLTVSGKTEAALAWYTSAEKTFATSDRDMPALLYWHAATMIQGGNVGNQGPRADKVKELLNRVVYDYGRSEYSGLARIALEQINQQN